MGQRYLFTSESVAEGHPDKICDQVSDALLDAFLVQDPQSRVAVECLTKTGFITIAGEVTSKATVDIEGVVRKTINSIGYNDPRFGFSGDACAVMVSLSKQSPDIAMGVNSSEGKEQGAGDQGLMFGYATNETSAYMPLPIMLSHALMQQRYKLRTNGTLDYLGPDGKCQVTVVYEDGKPLRVDTIVFSTQHDSGVSQAQISADVMDKIIKPVCGKWVDNETIYHINPTGSFVIGGPVGDSGLTGRKIIVDTYGGMGRHGGGCFSGKDPSKVDRSAAYAARYIAKNLVAAGLAERCEVQLAYAIGVAAPVSIFVDTFGTGKISQEEFVALIRKYFPLKPADIIRELGLQKPIYQKTAAYGHFGRNEPEFSWEKLDKAHLLRMTA